LKQTVFPVPKSPAQDAHLGTCINPGGGGSRSSIFWDGGGRGVFVKYYPIIIV